MESPILLARHDGWASVTLNRPSSLNSFNVAMHEAAAAAFAELDADESCRAVLLTGAGRAFCAGQDLAEAIGMDDLGVLIDKYYNPLIKRIRAMNKPVVCAVNGVAAGAGANLALACDIVLAARSASFLQAFARIGLVPDSGGTFFLPRLIGDARTRALTILAEPVTAERAEEWGMIWKVVDDDALAPEAEKLTAKLATQPTQSFALTKQALLASGTNTLDQQLDLERDLQRTAGRTPDYKEGVSAFIEKRKPKFTGKQP